MGKLSYYQKHPGLYLKKIVLGLILLVCNLEARSQNSTHTYISFGNNAQVPPKPWNRTGYNIQAGQSFPLLDEQGQLAGTMKLVSSWSSAPDLGVNTGNNLGLYPDQVMQSGFAYWGPGSSVIEFSGLDTSNYYDFSFFASWAHAWEPDLQVYQIYVNDFSMGSAQVEPNNDSTKAGIVSKVKPDRNGKILVKMHNAASDNYITLISAIVWTAYPSKIPVTAPTNISAQNISPRDGTNMVLVRWDTVSGASKYLVYRSNNLNGPFLLFDSVKSGEKNSRQISYTTTFPNSPSAGIYYDAGVYYKVKAISTSNTPSPFSQAANVYNYGPYDPVNLYFGSTFFPQSFNLNWTLFLSPFPGDSIRFYRSLTGLPNTFSLIGEIDANLQGNVYVFSDRNILPNTTYYYYATFIRNGKESFPSDIISGGTPCGQVKDLAVEALSPYSIDLKWSNINCADAYQIFRSTQKSGPYQAYTIGYQNYFIDSNLQAGTTYYYYVKPHYSNGNIQVVLDTLAVTTPMADQTLVNFGDNNSLAPSPWNNTGYSLNKGQSFILKDQNGKVFGKMNLLSSWTSAPSLGINTMNNSGIYPDKVISTDFAYYGSGKEQIQFSGLDTSKAYDFTFFASWANPWSSALMNYQIGSNQVILDISNNTNKTVSLNNNKPDNQGNIVVTLNNAKTGLNNTLLGAIILNSHKPMNGGIPAPGNISAYNVDNSSFILQWDSVPGAFKYFIYQSKSVNGSYILLDSNPYIRKVGSQLLYQNNLPSNSDSGAFFKVRAISKAQVISPFSLPAGFYTYGPLSPLQIGYGDQFYPSSFVIFWKENFNPMIGDKIHFYRSETSLPNSFKEIAVIDGTKMGTGFPIGGFTDTSLLTNTRYYYYAVLERNGINYQPSNLLSYSTPCGAVKDLSGQAISGNSINLKWSPVSCIYEYRIFRSTQKSGPYKEFDLGDENFFIDTGLVANTTYYYYVNPYYDNDNIQYANDTISITTKPLNQTFINFGNNASLAPSPWNNTGYNLSKGQSFQLLDQNGKPSGKMTFLTSWSNAPSQGVNTNNNSGIYPDKVINSDFAYNGNGKAMILFSGLDLSKAYDFTFFSSWSNPWSASQMIYQIDTAKASLDSKNNSSNTVTIKSARPDSNGNIQVLIGNRAGDGYTSLIGAILFNGYPRPDTIPPAPTNLTGIVLTDNSIPKDSIQLSWDKVPGISKYYIYTFTYENGYIKYDSINIDKNSGSRVFYIDRKTPFGGSHNYSIASVSSKNLFSTFSNQVSIVVPNPVSPFTLNLGSENMGGAINLNWTYTSLNPKVGDVIEILRSPINGYNFFTGIGSIPISSVQGQTNSFTFTDKSILPNTYYQYYLQLIRGGIGYSPSNTVSFTSNNCSLIYGLTAEPTSPNTVLLDWADQGECASLFTIYRSYTRNSGYTKVGSTLNTNYTDKVNPASTYYYYVQPIYPDGSFPSALDTTIVSTSALNSGLAFTKGQTASFFNPDSVRNSGLMVYPVPIQGPIHFSFYSNQMGNYTLSLYSLEGKLLYQLPNQVVVQGLNTGIIGSDLAGLKSGLYIIRVESPLFLPKVLTINKL